MHDAAPRLLARHAERRRQGLATVSVIVGTPAATAAAWRAAAAGGPVVELAASRTATAATLAAAVVAGTCRVAPLRTAAIAFVARRLDRPAAEVLAGKSPHDLEQLWRVLALTATSDEADADLLTAARLICAGTPDRWPAGLSAALPGWRAMAALDRLLADDDGGGRPPVWVALPSGSLDATAGPLAALAEAVPHWPIGVGTPTAPAGGATRAATMLSQGAVAVPTAVAGPRSTPPRIVTPRAAERAARRAAADVARSAAERRLFDLLQRRWPGRFRLNQRLGFHFGPRPAEADLFAADLRLVIEIDGYHHFANGDVAWRRDRHKDWRYQVHGYRCRRVLATDVFDRTAYVLDTVRQAVDDCDRHPLGGGSTGTP